MTKRLPVLPDLTELMESWHRCLVAENKSPTTITSYLRGVRLYLEWCAETGRTAELTREAVQTYAAELIAEGREANTVRLRQASLRAFSKWLVGEGELPADELVGLTPPKIPVKVTPALNDDQLRDLIKACTGKKFQDRRDEAIVRLMMETGVRASECVGLQLADVDFARNVVTIQKGKGGKGRVAPFSPATAVALDRYMRARRPHPLADSPALWLGVGPRNFKYFALNDALRARAKKAGITGFHLHLMRHTAATRWLRHGGSEGGLMAVCGWTSHDMLARYTGASASERAVDESRRLNLGAL
jgi:site-specific recombinase XerD